MVPLAVAAAPAAGRDAAGSSMDAPPGEADGARADGHDFGSPARFGWPGVSQPVPRAPGQRGSRCLGSRPSYGVRYGVEFSLYASPDGQVLADSGGGWYVCGEIVLASEEGELLDSFVKDEARIRPLRRAAAGTRERTWASTADECVLEGEGDWPRSGPRSTDWCLMCIKKEGRALELHHERFRQLVMGDYTWWGVSEHKEISSDLSLMALYDQYDVVNSAAAEAWFRRLQTTEFSYMEKVKDGEAKTAGGLRLTPEEQAIFGGLACTIAALMVSPPLLDFARLEAERAASLAKNLRRARGERQAARKK